MASAALIEKAQQYIAWTPNVQEKEAIQLLLDQMTQPETSSGAQDLLEKAMLKRISFGTAGLRAAKTM